MHAEEFLERIQRELQKRFRAAGSGSVGRVEQALELADGYFRDQRRPGRRRVDLKILHDALGILDVDLAEFFTCVLGTVEPVEVFRERARSWRRQRNIPILEELANRQGDPAEPVRVDFESLDALRDSDTRHVRRTTQELVPQVSSEDLPRVLGIHASACRALGRLDEAHQVLVEALEMVGEDRPSLRGELLLRCASVAGDRADYEEALALAVQATCCYAMAGDAVSIGKAMLKQGMALGSLGRSEEELRAFHAAARLLPGDSDSIDVKRNIFSCHMNLAEAYRKTGDLEKARHYAGLAENTGEAVGPALFGVLVWLRGSIARQLERHAEAEEHLQRALEMHREVAPVSTALLAVEVVQVQMLQGHVRRAHETARMMASLLRPLERHPLASAAITELVRCALSSRGLTLSFLESLARGIEEKQTTRTSASR